MAEATDRRGIFLQNLEDAGCGPETVQECLKLADACDWNGLHFLLSRHRKVLLYTVHAKQKELDCLDFLLFQIERKGDAMQ